MRTKPGLRIAAVLSALTILLPLIGVSNTVARRGAAMSKTNDGSGDHQARVTQNGVIEINGCVVRRDDLTLTATPVQFGASGKHNGDDGGEDDDGSGDDQQRRAKITETSDPHIFDFEIDNLSGQKIYTLDVRVRSTACGKVTWVSPKHGLIVPGQQTSVRIRGFALTTQLDVQTTDATGSIKFLGADALSLASATRTFRWHTDLAGVTAAELQIALDRFSPDNCANPTGLIARISLPGGPGDNLTPPIDFNKLIFGGSGVNAHIGPDPIQFAVAHGAPLYVRVVPLDSQGALRCLTLTDGVAALVILDYLSALAPAGPPIPTLTVSGTYFPAQPVNPDDWCLTVVKFHHVDPNTALFLDPFGEIFLQEGRLDSNGNVQPGDATDFICGNNSSSLIDDIGDFISGVIEGVAAIVDGVAKLYDEIKQGVISFVAEAISSLGIINCDDGSPCRDGLNAAMAAALASMGLPPSLPTFNDLVNQGLDYVEGEIADESGLPKDAVDAVTRKVIDAANSAQGGGGGLPDWLVDDNRFRPSQLILTVTRPATTGDLPAALVIGTDPNALYPAVSIPLPSLLNPTGAQLTIPVQLAPNLNGTADLSRPPACLDPNPNDCFPQAAVLKFKLNDWFQNRFQQIPCSTFKIFGLHGGTFFEDLGRHALAPQGAAQFPTGNSNSCP